jgi:glycosyltransferase involved in cell wall biosynthesis
MTNFPGLPRDAAGSGRSRVLDVCVVTSEFLGAIKNGGIATATSGLVAQLVREGHRVTILYTLVEQGRPTADKPWAELVATAAAAGIELLFIPHQGDYRAWRMKSWEVKEFFRTRHFDVVYFNEHHGSGYYTLAAKRAGLFPFSQQLHCVICHGAIEWVFDTNDQYIKRPADLEMMGMERRTFEWADVAIAPSQYLLEQYRQYGWKMPAQVFCQPYPLAESTPRRVGTGPLSINELVFFGRLEARKGLWLFCEALERLSQELAGTLVTFLGRSSDVDGIASETLLVSRSANWPFRVRLLTNFDQDQALAYLQTPGRLAVMPSLKDNSPCVIYECIGRGIPFISTLGSGGAELVHPASLPEVMVEPNVTALAARLSCVLREGAKLGRLRFDPLDNLAAWAGWHRYLGKLSNQLAASKRDNREAAESKLASVADGDLLIVMIDDGEAPLSVLISTISVHIKQFGDRVGYLVLTARRAALQNLFYDLFSATGATVCILGTDAAEDADALIKEARTVVFCDADTEIRTAFLAAALRLLGTECAAISCVVAERDASAEASVQHLPSGDIPAVSALGHPIGSGVWAASVQRLGDLLRQLDLVDQQFDAPVGSAILGQRILHLCRARGLPFHVLPVVGGIATRNREVAPRRHRLAREPMRLAGGTDVVPSVFLGGPPWLAISGFGAHRRRPEPLTASSTSVLSPGHPLRVKREPDLTLRAAESAASFGRPELALQLGAAAAVDPTRALKLIDLAIESARNTPPIDLCPTLSGDAIWVFGDGLPHRRKLASSERVEEQSRASEVDASAPVTPRSVSVYVEGCSLDNAEVHVPATLGTKGGSFRDEGARASAARLVLFDIPVAGHRQMTARMRAKGFAKSCSVRIALLDQQTGEEIGCIATKLCAQKPVTLRVPTYGIYGAATMVCEFRAQPNLRLKFEALTLD